MRTDTSHPLVVAYLARLRESAALLPPEDAADLVADITEHLDVALADVDVSGDVDAQVRTVLHRTGEPSALVADAAPGGSRAMVPGGEGLLAAPSSRDRNAVLMLLLTAPLLVVPPLGVLAWIVGLVRLVRARCWTPTEKGVGGLGLAGPFPLYLLLVGLPASAMWVNAMAVVAEPAHNAIGGIGAELVFFAFMLAPPLVIQIASAWVLLRRAGRRAERVDR